MAVSFWDRIKEEKKPVVIYGTGNGADRLIDRLPSLTVKNEKKSRFPHNYAEFGTLFNCMIARYTTYFFVPAKIFFMFFTDTTSFDVQNPNAS